MTSDLDIHHAAAVFVREYGEDAPFQVGKWADLLLDWSDHEGVAAWLGILVAVKKLLAEEPEGMVH